MVKFIIAILKNDVEIDAKNDVKSNVINGLKIDVIFVPKT